MAVVSRTMASTPALRTSFAVRLPEDQSASPVMTWKMSANLVRRRRHE